MMKTPQRYTVSYRRKRAGLTNYKKRRLLLSGRLPRLVIRKSLHYIWLQVVGYGENGDTILAQSHSRELKALGWNFKANNLPAAYLTGLLLSRRCKESKVSELVLDLGLYSVVKGSRLFGALKGVLDGGVKVPSSPQILPDMKRIRGEHIVAYAQKAQKEGAQFAGYRASGVLPSSLPSTFDAVLQKISTQTPRGKA